jgi:hypothetical protein
MCQCDVTSSGTLIYWWFEFFEDLEVDEDPEVNLDGHSRDTWPVLRHLKQAPMVRKCVRSSAVSFFNVRVLGVKGVLVRMASICMGSPPLSYSWE